MHVLEACERFHTSTEMLNAVKSLQDFAVALNKLGKGLCCCVAVINVIVLYLLFINVSY